MKRYRAFLIPAAGLLAILIGFLVFNIRGDLVYYKVPDEVVGDATIGETDRFRLGGQVVPGSISSDDSEVTFSVTDGKKTIVVVHTGAPQQLFTEGIGVVVEGTWNGDIFFSDSMIIKHDEQYRTEDGGVYTPDQRFPDA
jgi:cytochrome c-type biogenesis protein CcmE